MTSFPLGFDYMLERLTELRVTPMSSSSLKDMIKDTDEQPDEDTHEARSERAPSAGASVTVELGCVTVLVCGGSPTWKFSRPRTLGFL